VSDDTGVIQVQTTVGRPGDADRLAALLVDGRLAACAQVVGPIRSRYRWRGAVETAEEWLLLVKTTRAAWPAVERAILAAHPYDEPELIAAGLILLLRQVGLDVGRLLASLLDAPAEGLPELRERLGASPDEDDGQDDDQDDDEIDGHACMVAVRRGGRSGVPIALSCVP
jgi:periplasmic divalent cation tolerance protein